jgi:hypothetical protein
MKPKKREIANPHNRYPDTRTVNWLQNINLGIGTRNENTMYSNCLNESDAIAAKK